MRAFIVGVAIVLMGIPGQGLAVEKKLFPAPSTASAADHTFERSGMSMSISRCAIPSVEKHEGPGYIGGAKLFRGDGRASGDGTFGWDYQGLGRFPGRIFLGWAHDRSRQPNLGSYKTDTHHVPDVVSLHPVRRVLDEKKGK